jgi:hypothetical protein
MEFHKIPTTVQNTLNRYDPMDLIHHVYHFMTYGMNRYTPEDEYIESELRIVYDEFVGKYRIKLQRKGFDGYLNKIKPYYILIYLYEMFYSVSRDKAMLEGEPEDFDIAIWSGTLAEHILNVIEAM